MELKDKIEIHKILLELKTMGVDLSAIPKIFEPVRFTDFIDPEKMLLTPDHVMGIGVPERNPEGILEKFEIYTGGKKEIERGCHELAIMLRERHGYTVDDERMTNAIWYLRKAGFLGGGDLTVYYFPYANPVIIVDDGTIALVLAPRIEDY